MLTLQHIGQVLQQLGRLDEAAGFFREALETLALCADANPSRKMKILNQLGNVYLQQGDVPSMMRVFSDASRLLHADEQTSDVLFITGFNHYGLSIAHPPCAPVA